MSDRNRTAPSPFDNLMAQMGVKPIGGAGAKGSRPPKAPEGRGRPAANTAQPAPMAPMAPSGPALPVSRPGAPATPSLAEDPRLVPLRAEASALRASLAEERARAEGLEAERDALRQQLEAAAVEREELDEHRKSLQRALSAASTSGPKAPPELQELLIERGLKPATEADTLLRAVAEAHVGGELVALLQAADGARAEGWLEDHVALVCGGERCPPPPGRAILIVPSARCEICGGSDVRRAVRLFVDATLMSGATRVTIVGGSPKYHRTLRELVSHRSLTVDLVPGNARRTMKQAQADLNRSNLVIIWGGTLLDHSTSELYEGGGPARVISIPQRGIARMLERATELLSP